MKPPTMLNCIDWMNRLMLTITAAVLSVNLAAATVSDPQALRALIDSGEANIVATRMQDRLESGPATADTHYWLAEALLAELREASVFRQMGLARKARANLEAAVALDGDHAEARFSLGQYFLQAPAIAGGSAEKAQVQADALLRLDPALGHRLMADIAAEADDRDTEVAHRRQALAAGAWSWEAQYDLVVMAVHHQVAATAAVLDEAREAVRESAEALETRQRLLDYQRGKYAAVSGEALESGAAALARYLDGTPVGDEPAREWAEFRLAQVERQLGQRDEAERRLAALNALELPEDLGFALRDERRWYYAD